MKNMDKLIVSAMVVSLVLSPLLAWSGPNEKGYLSNVSGQFYRGGVTVLEKTEDVVSGVLKRTFGFFNPCLDLVRGCTNTVLRPIEGPISYVESVTWGSKPKPVGKIPTPKKPEIPNK